LSWLQFDSEDEREEAEAQNALTHKIRSQSIKKSKKNQARLPRTAGLRTLSELSTELKKAGYDPSSIEARAGILAKVQAAKRKRAEADVDVDMDSAEAAEAADETDESDAGEWMDVDGEEPPTSKRAKGTSGAAIGRNSRAPRTNRQLGGLRDDQVNIFAPCLLI
jgi:nucleolar GTP-binding protein